MVCVCIMVCEELPPTLTGLAERYYRVGMMLFCELNTGWEVWWSWYVLVVTPGTGRSGSFRLHVVSCMPAGQTKLRVCLCVCEQ